MKTIQLESLISFRASTAGTALPSKFTGTAYSGGLIPSHGAVIDLSTTVVARRLPLLDSHVRSDIIGVVSATNVSGELVVSGSLFSDLAGSSAERIAARAVRGAPYQMSVGLFDYREVFLQAGQTMRVNGRDFTGPLTVLQSGTVREVSIVTLGADPQATAQFFGLKASQQAASVHHQLQQQISELRARLAIITGSEETRSKAELAERVSYAKVYGARRLGSLH